MEIIKAWRTSVAALVAAPGDESAVPARRRIQVQPGADSRRPTGHGESGGGELAISRRVDAGDPLGRQGVDAAPAHPQQQVAKGHRLCHEESVVWRGVEAAERPTPAARICRIATCRSDPPLLEQVPGSWQVFLLRERHGIKRSVALRLRAVTTAAVFAAWVVPVRLPL